MSSYPVLCPVCGREARLSQPGRYCRSACRTRAFHERTRAARDAATAHAELALTSGDLAALDSAARRTIALLQ